MVACRVKWCMSPKMLPLKIIIEAFYTGRGPPKKIRSEGTHSNLKRLIPLQLPVSVPLLNLILFFFMQWNHIGTSNFLLYLSNIFKHNKIIQNVLTFLQEVLDTGVSIHWTGLLDWNTGLDWHIFGFCTFSFNYLKVLQCKRQLQTNFKVAFNWLSALGIQ